MDFTAKDDQGLNRLKNRQIMKNPWRELKRLGSQEEESCYRG